MMRIALLLMTAIPLAAAEPDLNPKQTYAVVAGVLQWPVASRITGFPTKNRKDEELYETLRGRGVPAENMKLLLDEETTYSGIKRAIKSIASQAPKGSTLIVYYCGHGSPCKPGGELCLLNYDITPGKLEITGLLASDLAAMIQAEFKGQRVLLLADCCFSGGLAKTAASLQAAGFEAAAITSSSDQVISTLNWTFTQTVIDALKGDAFADGNGDGMLSLAELGKEVNGAMAALERQPSGTAFCGWKDSFSLAPSKVRAKASETKYKPGDYVLVPAARRAGRVLDAADGKYSVQFYDYTEKHKAEYAEEKIELLPKGWADRKAIVAIAEKAEIEVLWNDTWFPATIVRKDGEKTLIHYVGYDANWNEWVTKERLRPLGKP